MNTDVKQWITSEITRTKNPIHDLKITYKRTMRICMGIAFVLHIIVGIVFPTFKASGRKIERSSIIIENVDIPETRQIHRPPPPPRPAIPIATESADVPDDVTIETTDLDFEQLSADLPPPPPQDNTEEETEEILEFFMVEQKPEVIKQVPPEYPEVARKAGIEGSVILKVLIEKDGSVSQAMVVKGKDILQQAALNAIYQYRFSPAQQNDKPVKVWLTMPIRFQLIH